MNHSVTETLTFYHLDTISNPKHCNEDFKIDWKWFHGLRNHNHGLFRVNFAVFSISVRLSVSLLLLSTCVNIMSVRLNLNTRWHSFINANYMDWRTTRMSFKRIAQVKWKECLTSELHKQNGMNACKANCNNQIMWMGVIVYKLNGVLWVS